jgi:hypothetical protein
VTLDNDVARHLSPREQRQYERVIMELPGKLFVPADETTAECQVVNLSAGGAGIRCAEPPPTNTFLVLYIDGFGRFEGVTTRGSPGDLGLRFVCKEAKRQRLLDDLTSYVSNGVMTTTWTRRHPRVPSTSSGHFTRPSGEQVRCEILDVSVQGISMRTNGRPPIGELISLGKTCGRVVRHHDNGIAIQLEVSTEGQYHGD